MLSRAYVHHTLTRSMLSGGIGIGGRRIAGFHYEDGGSAGSGAGAEGKQDADQDGADGEDVTKLKDTLRKVRTAPRRM